ncbi:hypothetical protein [Altererythrobacter aquiaggeris]|uniref:hypothetical protein n=1 Tax=Aestuarierythrobacter aquiaggeris TaxID=1898396 RepID=UPI0030164ED5
MGKSGAFASALIFALGAYLPAAAAGDVSAARSALHTLQQQDARLQTIGWKLASGNAAFCEDAAPATGLLLQDMAGYSSPDKMREAAGIDGDIAVQAAAPGSPSDAAGLKANMAVLTVADIDIAALPQPKAGYERLQSITDIMERRLQDSGQLAIEVRSGAETQARIIVLDGVPACPGRFEMITGKKRASADGTRVLIGTDFAGLGYPEEELAAAIAHEMAHNLLYHQVHLNIVGRKQKNIRLTEREADRLMPWLLANAGYDPAAALRFMQRWGPRHGGGLFRKRTHDGWDERAEFIAAELPLIRASVEKSGSADWSADFIR